MGHTGAVCEPDEICETNSQPGSFSLRSCLLSRRFRHIYCLLLLRGGTRITICRTDLRSVTHPLPANPKNVRILCVVRPIHWHLTSTLLLVYAAICASQTSPPAGNSSSPALTSEQDHQRILDLLGIKTLRRGPDGDPKSPNAANVDESKVSPYTLPDPLTLKNEKRFRPLNSGGSSAVRKSSKTLTARFMAVFPHRRHR